VVGFKDLKNAKATVEAEYKMLNSEVPYVEQAPLGIPTFKKNVVKKIKIQKTKAGNTKRPVKSKSKSKSKSKNKTKKSR
jgi:hypothetical protein